MSILEKLSGLPFDPGESYVGDVINEAMTEIERLTAEVNTLEVTLKNVETGGMAYKRERDAAVAENSDLRKRLAKACTAAHELLGDMGVMTTSEALAESENALRECLETVFSQQEPDDG